ncbi:MAG: succinyl-diaminopimelate desuccinylase [Nitriliruptorales bacterium]
MDVIERLLELCSIPSVTGQEAGLADELAHRYADEEPIRVGDSVVVGRPDDRPLVLLVGHIDTVPPTDEDREARIEERGGVEILVGRGTSDMKSGVAVAEALFADRELRERSPYGLALVLYAREEGPAAENELADVLEEVAWLGDADLALVLEPTDLEVQLGCTGSLQAELVFAGRQAHSARPWHGESAITRALPVLAELAERQPVEVDVDGISYRDVLSATQAWTDNPKNVLPGSFTVNVNLRFAPSRGLDEAEEELRAWVGDRARMEVVDRAPPAPPRLDAPLVAAFMDRVRDAKGGKQGWTDVARFAEVGVPALNFGPGLTAQAHQAGEHVRVADVRDALNSVRAFLEGKPSGAHYAVPR